MFDYSKLKGRIVEICGNQRNFAKAINRSEWYVSRIMNDASYLDQVEIDTWAKALKIDDSDIASYFFTRKIDETQM